MASLEQIQAFALAHDTSTEGRAFISEDCVQVPVDCRTPDGRWFIEWTPVRTVREVRDALGY